MKKGLKSLLMCVGTTILLTGGSHALYMGHNHVDDGMRTPQKVQQVHTHHYHGLAGLSVLGGLAMGGYFLRRKEE